MDNWVEEGQRYIYHINHEWISYSYLNGKTDGDSDDVDNNNDGITSITVVMTIVMTMVIMW